MLSLNQKENVRSRNCWEGEETGSEIVMREETMESDAAELVQWRPQQALTVKIVSYLTGPEKQMAPPAWMTYCCSPSKSPIQPWSLWARTCCCLHLFVSLTHAFTSGGNTLHWLNRDHTSIVQLRGKLERWVYSSSTVKGLCFLVRLRSYRIIQTQEVHVKNSYIRK